MPNATPVSRFICTSKRCLKMFRSFTVRKRKTNPETVGRNLRRRETVYLSSTSLDKRRASDDSQSIDTIITWLDDSCCMDNHFNEKLEQEICCLELLV